MLWSTTSRAASVEEVLTMEWTDERMDDLAARMDAGFARVDHDVRELRGDVKDLRGEMHQGFADLRSEMTQGFADLRSMQFRFELTMIAAMAGLVAATVSGALGG
jgi:hypothetical protein